MKKEPTGSTLSLAILGLIAQAPCSGYDVRKVFATTPMGHFSASPGAIYPALKRLEKEGLIGGTVDRAQTLRPGRSTRSLRRGGRACAMSSSGPSAARTSSGTWTNSCCASSS